MSAGIALAGFVVGTLVGMTGIGGSAFMAPILILVLGVSPSLAVGTDLFYSIPMKWVGAWQHHRLRHVHMPTVWALARGSVPGALIGALVVTRWVRADSYAEEALRRALGGTLLIVALLILWHVRSHQEREESVVRELWYHHPWVITLWGGVVGVLTGSTSIGSGSLLVPFLLLLPLGTHQVVGTDVAHAAVLVTAAGLTHMAGGTVNMSLAFNLLLGAIPGVLFGSRFSSWVPDHWLRAGLAILLLVLAVRLLIA